MRWLGHVTSMKDSIPKDLLYGELATGKRPTGQPQLCFKNVCKRDLQALDINTDSWEVIATDRDAWRYTVKVGLSQYEETQLVKSEEKMLHKKTACLASRPITAFTCSECGRDCHSPKWSSQPQYIVQWVQIYGLLRPTDTNDFIIVCIFVLYCVIVLIV